MVVRIAKQFIFLILGFVASCLFLESLNRSFQLQNIKLNFEPIQYELAFGIPNATKAGLDLEMGNSLTYPNYRLITNSNHLRSLKVPSYIKPPDTIRILCLGDSVFFGRGVDNDEIFTFYLDRLLNSKAENYRYEIINSSSPGWGLLEYITYFKNEGYKYSPDLVLISHSYNDMWGMFAEKIEWERLEVDGKTMILNGPRILLGSKFKIHQIMRALYQLPFIESAAKFSHLLNLIRLRLTYISRNPASSLVLKEKRLDHFLKAISFSGLDQSFWKFETFEFQIPRFKNNALNSIQREYKDTLKTQASIVSYYFLINYLLQTIRDTGAEPLILHIPTLMEILQISKVDLLPSIKIGPDNTSEINLLKPFMQFLKHSNIPIFYPHDHHQNDHFTPSGHRLVAQILFNFFVLEPSGLLPIRPTKALDIYGQEMKSILKHANQRIEEELTADPFWVFTEAMQYKNTNQLAKAKKTFHQYIALKPDDYEAHFQMGMTYLSERNYIHALRYLKPAAQNGNPLEKPRYRYVYRHARLIGPAWIHFQNHQDTEALVLLNRAESLKGYLLDTVHNLTGVIHARNGNLDKAEFYFRKAIELKPKNSEYYRTLGNLYFDNQRYLKAIKKYRQTLDKNPKDLKVYAMIALAYRQLGNEIEGLKWFQQFLARCGNNCGNMLKQLNLIASSSNHTTP